MANSAPPSRKGMGPTPGSFKLGDPRINRSGRPRAALAAAAAVRELVDPEDWVAFELAIASDESKPLDVRRASWHALIDRGFVRAPAVHDVNITATSSDAAAWDGVPLDVRRQKLLELRQLREGASSGEQRSHEPKVTDEDPAGDT